MQVIPAIDLKGGQCVRLRQGLMNEATVYGSDPVQTARQWQEQGGTFLHLVDLDGAFAGHPVHTEVFSRIAQSIQIPFEVGGGLRSDEDVKTILDAGASRAILGTRAVQDVEAVKRLVKKYGSAIAVGIDARQGRVQIQGWAETTPTSAIELAQMMADCGVSTIIYTDTATDGMLTGPNLTAMQEMADAIPSTQLIASGGVSTPADITHLIALKRPNLSGVIVGKALYEGRAALAEFVQASHPQ